MNSVNSPLYFIGQGDWEVPNPNDAANEEGLIALSWELYPEMYERLYPTGIFPWFDQDGVVFWFSPPVRSVTPTDAGWWPRVCVPISIKVRGAFR